jgi:hypothetical protein
MVHFLVFPPSIPVVMDEQFANLCLTIGQKWLNNRCHVSPIGDNGAS